MKYTWDDVDSIFELNGGAAQELASEHLADHFDINIEMTINLPITAWKHATLIQKVETLKSLHRDLLAEYNSTTGAYTIEYCKSGEPHIHAYMNIKLHYNFYQYGNEEILKMFAKSIFLKLPKKLYKQFSKAEVNTHLNRFRSPAVVLNIKNVLSKGWVDYMYKNAPVKN